MCNCEKQMEKIACHLISATLAIAENKAEIEALSDRVTVLSDNMNTRSGMVNATTKSLLDRIEALESHITSG